MKSLCRTCGETFGGLRGFERHRVGEFNNQPPHYGRRCLTAAELEAKGQTRNGNGVWVQSYFGPGRAAKARPAAQTDDPLPGEGVAPGTSTAPQAPPPETPKEQP